MLLNRSQQTALQFTVASSSTAQHYNALFVAVHAAKSVLLDRCVLCDLVRLVVRLEGNQKIACTSTNDTARSIGISMASTGDGSAKPFRLSDYMRNARAKKKKSEVTTCVYS